MRREVVEVLVTKNSGGAATYGKVEAARRLGLPVIVVQRPARPEDVPVLHDLAAVLDWIEAHRAAP
jgi:precorrin-6A/cobalt-precorrin-6A reductase